MGWRFDLKYANAVAYITIPDQKEPPRLTGQQLEDFLGSIQGYGQGEPRLWSEDKMWVNEITRIAQDALNSLASNRWSDKFLDSTVIKDTLTNLRHALGRFQL